jgi:hypothetical protein
MISDEFRRGGFFMPGNSPWAFREGPEFTFGSDENCSRVDHNRIE